MNQLDTYENPTSIPDRTESFSVSSKKKERVKRIPFATIEQLRNWHDTEGKDIIDMCIRSKNYKEAWKTYTNEYNLEHESIYGWRLQTTIDGVIQAFGVKQCNLTNLKRLLIGKDSVLHGYITEETLTKWYIEIGNTIVEECKKSDNPIETWKQLVGAYNEQNLYSEYGLIPTSINGIMYAFGVKTSSFYNVVRLLSGKGLTEEEKNSSKNKYRATKEQLMQWYDTDGRKIIEECRKSGNFTKAWRTYVDDYNKNEFYESGFRLPNNKVGLGTDLGANKYSVSEIVRIFERIPEGGEIPAVKKETETNKGKKEQLMKWYENGGREVIIACRKSENVKKTWLEYVTIFNQASHISGVQLPLELKTVAKIIGCENGSIEEIVRVFEGLGDLSEVPAIEKEIQVKIKQTIVRIKKEKPPKTPRIPKTKKELSTKTKKASQSLQEQKTMDRSKEVKLPVARDINTSYTVIYPQDTGVLSTKIQEKTKDSTESILRRQSLEQQISDLKKPITEKAEKKKKKAVEEKPEEKELSAWMIDFSRRFPNFLEINHKYYIVFRKFVQSLEKAYPSEEEITNKHVRISADGRTMMTIIVEKDFLYTSNASHILDIFSETQEWYMNLSDHNKKLPFVEMDLHIEMDNEEEEEKREV